MMDRRLFLKQTSAGAAAAGATLAVPAIAQSEPAVRWRMASSYPKSLDNIFGGAEGLAKRVSALTGGKFEIRVFASGELVPGFEVLNACEQGTIECGQTQGYYFIGKNKAFAFDSALPFGLNARMHNAWLYYGGGLELVRELYREHNTVVFPGGNSGAQMGGWWRSEFASVADLKGRKLRIPGSRERSWRGSGPFRSRFPPVTFIPALEKGTIDAAEWVGPYDDEKLGLYRVAPHYYFPGWWEGCSVHSFIVNLKEWEQTAAFLSRCLRSGVSRGKRAHDRRVRRKESAGARAPVTARREAASFSQGGNGCGDQGRARALR